MSIVESQKSYDLRLLFFYGALGALLLSLIAGLGYRQLLRADVYAEAEKVQNQRRVLIPGPRGTITDREGRVLVGNRPRFSAVLDIAQLRREFHREQRQVVRNYREIEREMRPSIAELNRLARSAVAQRYLDEVNAILGRHERVDGARLERQVGYQLLLPFVLVDDLSPPEYVRLLEQLPVRGPLQVYSSSMRFYPYRNAAAHVLGYVGANDELPAADIEGEDLRTFHQRGTIGKTGLELKFDDTLQGQTGAVIYRVDPVGFKIPPPLVEVKPTQGGSVMTSLDIDLQLAADRALEGRRGGAVAIEVATGEVLVLASKPDFDLNELTPSIPTSTYERITEEGGWFNRAMQGYYPPGSTFKLITACAALRGGAIRVDEPFVCNGFYQVGNRLFECHARAVHGSIGLVAAIQKSCNVFFYQVGLEAGPESIAAEARRFHLHEATGIELPFESPHSLVPDPAWKRQREQASWNAGDTANMAIGQGYLQFSPLQAACEMASFARREGLTVPTILHQPGRAPSGNRPREPLQLPDRAYEAVVDGLEHVVQLGTGKHARIDGVRVAGKTGTAQKTQRNAKTQKTERINIAWFVAFAPVERPVIAVAVALEGDQPDEEYGGGTYAAPVVREVMKAYFDKLERRQAAGEGFRFGPVP